MAEGQRNPDELGALWIKSSQRGEYMTGTINGQAVVVFRNERKREGSNAPDWRVLKSKPQDGKPTSRPERTHERPRPAPSYSGDPDW